MRRLMTAVVVVALLLCGCARVQNELFKFDDQNAKNSVSLATQAMKHWKMNSKYIKTRFPGIMNDDRFATVKNAILELDRIRKAHPEETIVLSEEEAGEVLALIGRGLDPAMQALLKKYAPDFLEFVQSIFGKALPAMAAL